MWIILFIFFGEFVLLFNVVFLGLYFINRSSIRVKMSSSMNRKSKIFYK